MGSCNVHWLYRNYSQAYLQKMGYPLSTNGQLVYKRTAGQMNNPRWIQELSSLCQNFVPMMPWLGKVVLENRVPSYWREAQFIGGATANYVSAFNGQWYAQDGSWRGESFRVDNPSYEGDAALSTMTTRVRQYDNLSADANRMFLQGQKYGSHTDFYQKYPGRELLYNPGNELDVSWSFDQNRNGDPERIVGGSNNFSIRSFMVLYPYWGTNTLSNHNISSLLTNWLDLDREYFWFVVPHQQEESNDELSSYEISVKANITMADLDLEEGYWYLFALLPNLQGYQPSFSPQQYEVRTFDAQGYAHTYIRYSDAPRVAFNSVAIFKSRLQQHRIRDGIEFRFLKFFDYLPYIQYPSVAYDYGVDDIWMPNDFFRDAYDDYVQGLNLWMTTDNTLSAGDSLYYSEPAEPPYFYYW